MDADANKERLLNQLNNKGVEPDKLALVDRLLDAKQGGKPSIHLTPDRVACPGHMAPFREQWPVGWSVFAVKLLERVIQNPKVQAALDNEEDHITAFNAMLDTCPMCCRATPKLLLEAYDEVQSVVAGAEQLGAAGLWPVHTCLRCKKRNRSALIEFKLPNTAQPQYAWVCLPCIARYRSPQASSYGGVVFRNQ